MKSPVYDTEGKQIGWAESLPAQSYAEQREAAYLAEGVTPDALAIAIREKLGEGRSEAFDALQAKVAAIKARYPKPL